MSSSTSPASPSSPTTDSRASTASPASYEVVDGVATIVLDDGKVNAMSPRMQEAIHAALDRAEPEGCPVVITGRPGVFSAGFDLAILNAGGPAATEMVRGGFELARRLLSFPRPVILGCTGHAVAMGTFLLLAGDVRIGVEGDYRLTANEVAIGLTMPHPAIAILRDRLTPSAFQRVAVLAEPIPPSEAVAAGYLDRIVPAEDLAGTLRDVAALTAMLDAEAHAATKARVRASLIAAIDDGIAAELRSAPVA